MKLKAYEITGQWTLEEISAESLSSAWYDDATHRWLDIEFPILVEDSDDHLTCMSIIQTNRTDFIGTVRPGGVVRGNDQGQT